jgi:hypothetical protein
MPRNATKRHCIYPRCRAWAMRGFDTCASHRDYAPDGAATAATTTPGAAAPAPDLGHPHLAEVAALTQSSETPTRRGQIEYLIAVRSALDRCIVEGPLDSATVNYATLVTRITQTILGSLDKDDASALDETIRELAEELEALCVAPRSS